MTLLPVQTLETAPDASKPHLEAAQKAYGFIPNLTADFAALRDGTEIADPKLQALHVFTARINEGRGHVTQADLNAFLSAGYTEANSLDVILGAGLKTLSNYTNHSADTPL